MSRHESASRKHAVLNYLNHLPRRILLMHNNDGIAELLLHELCSDRCFNLKKAVYFVDNPDFDCLKGVAGICREEVPISHDDVWSNPDNFIELVRSSSFNNMVRGIQRVSMTRSKERDEDIMAELAHECNIIHPQCYVWDMKHENRGLFICEAQDDPELESYLQDGVCLLGFCPIV